MMNRLFASGLIICALLAATVYSQSDGGPKTVAYPKGLKDAYAGAFLIGMSDTRSWRRGQDALLFDGQLNPKPAYKAVGDIAPHRK
jgi:hypothetical protein